MAQLVASMSGVMLGGVVEVVGSYNVIPLLTFGFEAIKVI